MATKKEEAVELVRRIHSKRPVSPDSVPVSHCIRFKALQVHSIDHLFISGVPVVVIGICVKLATELVFRCPLKQSFILTTLTPLYAIIVTTVGFVMVGLLALDANEVSGLYRDGRVQGQKGTE
jgi:hypothetical protein